MTKPNLFKFATGELSQDAFIRWSLVWGQQKEDISMRRYGLSFLNAMLEKHGYNVKNLEYLTIIDVENQKDSIDVLVNFKIKDQQFELIIEDKTSTMMHSNQIERYFDIRKKRNPNKTIIGIYYKTGFIFDDEERKLKALRNANYPVECFDKEEILNCMSKCIDSTYSDIFHDYYCFIKEKFDKEQKVLLNIHDSNIKIVEESLKTQVGQVEAIKTIFSDDIHINRGSSFGRPWVHYGFKMKNHEEILPDKLFYRIDRKKNGFYISLRQYMNLKKEADEIGPTSTIKKLKEEKLKRLCKLIKLYDEVMSEIKNDIPDKYIEPGIKTTDQIGFNESEIGIFYFTNENTVEKFNQFFEVFHNRFCEKVFKAFQTKNL